MASSCPTQEERQEVNFQRESQTPAYNVVFTTQVDENVIAIALK